MFSFSRQLSGQTNLVPNPSFEFTVQCPSTNQNITDCANWMSFGYSPEYFNACGPSGVSVPYAGFGFQYALTGNGMAGLVTYINPLGPCSPDCREYIGAQLTNTLQIGTKYFMSFFVNHSGFLYNWKRFASNKTGLRFSTVASTVVPKGTLNVTPVNNFAHLYTNTIYGDTLNWLKISGSFIADSVYKYVIIGNFFNDTNTDTISYPGPIFGSMGAYYFIDDVCVSTDSTLCNVSTGLNQIEKDRELLIYPNPASGHVSINFSNQSKINSFHLFNIHGQIIIEKINYESNKIDITNVPDGIYIVKIIADHKTYFDKIIVRH